MERTERKARWFGPILAAIAITGLLVRVLYVLLERRDIAFVGDAYFYHAGANLLADGKGFISPYAYADGQVMQAADHPPLYIIFLAVPSLLRMTSVMTHLVWSCLLGTATIVVVGYLGRTVANERAGILAAAVAAVYPGFWAFDGSLQAETLAVFATALVLLFSYRFWRKPSGPRMVAVGVACGAAALARSELVLLVPLLVAPLGLLVRSAAFRRRVRLVAVGSAAALVVIAPWVGYNIVRFRHPVFLSSQFDSLLASANCDSVYYGPGTGYFSIPCAAAVAKRHHLTNKMDESEQAIVFRRAAVEYIRDHQSRLPIVAAERVGRILGVFHPSHQLAADVVVDGREVPVSRAALFSFYALTLLSFAGVIVLRRRGATPVFPLIAVLVMVVLTVALTYGDTRFRAPAEVVLAILAAVALDAGISAVSARRRDRHDQAGPRAIGDTESGFVRVSEPR